VALIAAHALSEQANGRRETVAMFKHGGESEANREQISRVLSIVRFAKQAAIGQKAVRQQVLSL
jgi:hypothetical protein